jgi:hypothetical protein
VGDVFFAGEEADKGAAILGDVIADCAAEGGVAGFEGVENGALSDGGGDLELDFAVGAGEGAEMGGEDDADHWIVWTSTETTEGRSRTIGDQLLPASGEA